MAIGLRYRVSFLLLATVLASIGVVAMAVDRGWSFRDTIFVLFPLLMVLQASYLAGVFIASQSFVRRDDDNHPP